MRFNKAIAITIIISLVLVVSGFLWLPTIEIESILSTKENTLQSSNSYIIDVNYRSNNIYKEPIIEKVEIEVEIERTIQEEFEYLTISQSLTKEEQVLLFIDLIAPQMSQEHIDWGLWASPRIAQAILESSIGSSGIAQNTNNLFGVKTDDDDSDYEVYVQEFINGQWQSVKSQFKTYDAWHSSITDQGELLCGRQYTGFRTAQTVKQACFKLQTSGYATDERYYLKLISIINSYDLTRFDREEQNDYTFFVLKEGGSYRPPETRILQDLLISHGYDIVSDGDFGPSTTEAVKDFQLRCGLVSDGKVGIKTHKKLIGYEDF
jgi:hypothetical protein